MHNPFEKVDKPWRVEDMTTLSGISKFVERTVHFYSYTRDMFMHGRRVNSRLLDSFAISRLKNALSMREGMLRISYRDAQCLR